MTKELKLNMPKGRGRKPHLYMVLDCETATLPFVSSMDLSVADKRKIAIAKPLIYDIAWRIVDRKGKVYAEHSYLIQETFFVPQIFNTAYYKDKRNIYMARYKNGDITAKSWNDVIEILTEELSKMHLTLAYNSMFDFKKAIVFTESYIKALYSENYQNWEDMQKKRCAEILQGQDYDKPEFDGENLVIREQKYPIADLWGLTCDRLINNDEYKLKCLETKQFTASGLYFKTSAESTFRYLTNNYKFEESHTAYEDCLIECEILKKCLRMKAIDKGMEYFPFRALGTTVDFIIENKPNLADNVVNELIEILEKSSSRQAQNQADCLAYYMINKNNA